ncbi:related to negative transcription regulator [Claviceps purpurea 20.1]|uniref:Mediator of RNA polymerase II transcription subunit 10 n=1 Tax=Claviceps purpurea (strain 20.1) TaxID=1111077 RepID=M1WGC9_CLAP2|nr:related to negative transcription regulator [Claviceps purpurea 20.1]
MRRNKKKTLSHSIKSIHEVSSSPTTNLPLVPPELLDYVESGRNPDIYTREFTELTRRGNQLMRGKALAFGDFRDVLAREISTAMPELRGDVERVVEETGGRRTVANGKKGGLWNGRGSGDDSEGDGSESGSGSGIGNGNESEVGTGMGMRMTNGNRMGNGNGNGNGNGSRNGVMAGSALAAS